MDTVVGRIELGVSLPQTDIKCPHCGELLVKSHYWKFPYYLCVKCFERIAKEESERIRGRERV